MRTRGRARAEPELEPEFHDADTTYVAITGANTGLGLATCLRLIDEFVQNRPESQSIHLIITTRSPAKSNATLETIRKHINRHASLKAASGRIAVSSHEVDLTRIRTVLKLAATLNETYPFLSSLICNAGIGGTLGINWLQAVGDVITHPVSSVTWPAFNKHSLRSLARPQTDVVQGLKESEHEPPLGDVFAANVFGHYILSAHLMPLFQRSPHAAGPGRIIWVSSIETYGSSFSMDDIQCLNRREAYSSSKALTDILVLTSTLHSTHNATKSFFSTDSSSAPTSASSRPNMYLSHPGVASTEIMPLSPPLRWAKLLLFYLARFLGSPWHTISARNGATSTVWLALVPAATLDGIEQRDGKGKWGSATDVFGSERVMRSNVDGWGYGGVVGMEGKFGRKGQRPGTVDLTPEDRDKFEQLGKRVWEEMEKTRLDWEARLAATGE